MLSPNLLFRVTERRSFSVPVCRNARRSHSPRLFPSPVPIAHVCYKNFPSNTRYCRKPLNVGFFKVLCLHVTYTTSSDIESGLILRPLQTQHSWLVLRSSDQGNFRLIALAYRFTSNLEFKPRCRRTSEDIGRGDEQSCFRCLPFECHVKSCSRGTSACMSRLAIRSSRH